MEGRLLIRVRSTNGELVYQHATIGISAGGEIPIDLTQLSQGIYMLEVLDSQGKPSRIMFVK